MTDTSLPDLLRHSAGELAGLVREGEVTARELTAASLDRIETLDPTVGAFTHVDADGALAAAEAIGPGDRRPFAGVPIAIKDNRPVEGMPLTFGAELFGDFVAPFDVAMVRRIREAGFVIVGKTSLPEYGILPTTEPRRFGPTRNPWDLERTPGGSSGGSAAAVAAGMVPLAHGNDGGGSIRIPAACCGLVGLKPQRGRISYAPFLGDQSLVVDGVLTRSTADSAEVLDLLAGYEVGDATWAPPPPEPFATTMRREPGRLRIAFTTTPPLPDRRVDPAAATAVHEAATLLGELGHEVEEGTPPWAAPEGLALFSANFLPLIASSIAFAGTLAGREPQPADMEALSWFAWERSRALDGTSFVLAFQQLQGLARTLIAWQDTYDALLTPALAERPLPIGTLTGDGPDPDDTFRRSGYFTPFTAIANFTGQPAISVPLFHGEDDLPLAVQLFGRPAQEGVLLALSAQLEEARPWTRRFAPIELPA